MTHIFPIELFKEIIIQLACIKTGIIVIEDTSFSVD